MRVAAMLGAGLALILGLAALAGIFVVRGYLDGTPRIPEREALWRLRRAPGLTFLDRNGQVIATRGAKYGQAVTLANIPAYVPQAFLAAEDRRFYRHGPLDLKGLTRAFLADLKARKVVQGGSTLTQQLARTLFLGREESLKRKVQEAFLAWSLEQTLSKDQILELYLNRTYFGAGAYGLEAAAHTYFGKPASQLSLAEAATLAGLPNAPSRLALTNDLPAALRREQLILGVMRQAGWITAAAMRTASLSPISVAPPSPGEGAFAYALDQAAAQAALLTGDAQPDLVIRTTIDPALQRVGLETVREGVLGLGAKRQVSQGALVTLAPDGAILAMVGGVDHEKSPFNRVVQAKRQPGSAFKPFVYGAALEQGLTPTTVREDAPISYGEWDPENYGHDYAGPVSLTEALARSLNTVSVRLALELGPAQVAAFARRLGLQDIPTNPGPSIALGAYEVTPLELAAGYQVFQNGGGLSSPYLISEIRSASGEVLYLHASAAPTVVYDRLYASRLVGMLKGVIAFGTGTAANIGRPAAGKTGTSQNSRDAWFVGFTPELLTAVWVGNDDGRPMAKVTGGELPAQIWRRFMTAAERDIPPHDFPWLTPEPPVTLETASVWPDDAEAPPQVDAPPAGPSEEDFGPRGDRDAPSEDRPPDGWPPATGDEPPPGVRPNWPDDGARRYRY